jgi:hypothetical protein
MERRGVEFGYRGVEQWLLQLVAEHLRAASLIQNARVATPTARLAGATISECKTPGIFLSTITRVGRNQRQSGGRKDLIKAVTWSDICADYGSEG